MCGIAGFLGRTTQDPDRILKDMTDAVNHRGPDDEGRWCDPARGVALGHRRLAVLDLSPAGHQPMHSSSGRYVVVFNGEIYNHGLIRAELEGLSPRRWRGHSDTEVMLEAFEDWGIEAAVRRFIGMFAIALWDLKEKQLYLIRDRLGEKPLYYGFFEDTLLFGSELKALRAHPIFSAKISRGSLALYMRYSYVPTPYTMYEDVYKLFPGTIVKFGFDGSKIRRYASVCYWSARETAERGLREPFQGSHEEAAAALEGLLSDAVGKQMAADVPLGAFLSGGIDSSTIVALMQAQSQKPVKTFTIGFSEKQYDEAAQARDVARRLGTDHTELYVSYDRAMDMIPMLPKIYDEPFGDSSQVPTLLVSQMTRRHVTVSLSGDAGDELFGGYNRYTWGKKIWDGISATPRFLRSAAAGSVAAISPGSWDRLYDLFSPILPGRFKQRIAGDKMHKLAGMLDAKSHSEMYIRQVSAWKDMNRIMPGTKEPSTTLTDSANRLDTEDFVQQMMYLDLITYLPDDILVKVDRAAMAVSLETRMPFLDHRVVNFAWKLPLSLKIADGRGKWILRQVLYRYLPKEMVERPKMGFGVPIDAWLRGPLREWAETLLNKDRILKEGFLNPDPICDMWREHLSGRRNRQHQLWNVLMFQAWLENQNL